MFVHAQQDGARQKYQISLDGVVVPNAYFADDEAGIVGLFGEHVPDIFGKDVESHLGLIVPFEPIFVKNGKVEIKEL